VACHRVFRIASRKRLNTQDTEEHRGERTAHPIDYFRHYGSPRLTDEPKNISPDDMEQAIAGLNQELASLAGGTTQRIDCNSENIEQGLARLVLSLIELLRRLLERQAIRRMEGGTLADAQIEEMGLALMKLEQKIRELASQFGLRPEDLNLDLGPLGQLWTEENNSNKNR
jgi:gas vesicle protein GvpK